jgi:PASTA domain-containing protein
MSYPPPPPGQPQFGESGPPGQPQFGESGPPGQPQYGQPQYSQPQQGQQFGESGPQFVQQPPTVPPFGYGTPAPAPKGNVKVGLAIIGAFLVLCIGGVVAVAVAGGDGKPAAPQALAASAAALPKQAVATATTTSAPAPTTSAAAVPATKPAVAAPETKTQAVTVAVPDLRGENAAVAQDALEKLGFSNIQLGSQDVDDTWVVLPQNWTVKKQSAKPGKKIALDTLIVLTCTKQG